MLELSKICKEYIKDNRKIEVLKNIQYTFQNNKFYCIYGNSGAGKTTLIEMLGLLLNPTSGEIRINGKRIDELSDNEKANIRNQQIGFVFQSFYLNPIMKAYENVMLPIYLDSKISNREKKERAYKLLATLGLKDRETNYPKQLSGGEQQRVAIARALINRPKIILTDEPTGALDSENEQKVLEILKKLAIGGKCVIVVSHNKVVQDYADVVLKIEKGMLKKVKHEK